MRGWERLPVTETLACELCKPDRNGAAQDLDRRGYCAPQPEAPSRAHCQDMSQSLSGCLTQVPGWSQIRTHHTEHRLALQARAHYKALL